MKTKSWTNEKLSTEFAKLVVMEPQLEELVQKARLIAQESSPRDLFYIPFGDEKYSLKYQMSRLIGHARGSPELTDDDYLDLSSLPKNLRSFKILKLDSDRLEKPRTLGGDPYLFSSDAYEVAYEYLYRLTSQ